MEKIVFTIIILYIALVAHALLKKCILGEDVAIIIPIAIIVWGIRQLTKKD